MPIEPNPSLVELIEQGEVPGYSTYLGELKTLASDLMGPPDDDDGPPYTHMIRPEVEVLGHGEPYSDEQNEELERAQDWLATLPEDDERIVILRLLNHAYSALDARTILSEDPLRETAPPREAIGTYLYPDDGEQPILRLYRRREHP
jgi:hypothetical protein